MSEKETTTPDGKASSADKGPKADATQGSEGNDETPHVEEIDKDAKVRNSPYSLSTTILGEKFLHAL